MPIINDNQQQEVTLQRGMPVTTPTSEQKQSTSCAVQFYYWNSNVYTVDAGEAIGTLIVGPLLHRNIKGVMGDVTGSGNDSSLVWTTGTTLTTQRAFRSLLAEEAERNGFTAEQKALAVTAGFTAGEFCIDEINGIVYGIKADTGTTDTATYNILAGSSSTSKGTYNLVAPTLSDGDEASIQLDNKGNTKMTMSTGLNATDDSVSTKPLAPTNINTSAYAASLVVKNIPGFLYELRGYTTLTTQWVQLHDAAALPANGAVPEDITYPDSTGKFEFTFPQGKSFTTGIVVCNSTTGPTKTIGAANCWFSAEFS